MHEDVSIMWYYAVYVDIIYQKTWVSINVAVQDPKISHIISFISRLISCFITKYPGNI